jgi:peroxiredoxin
LGVALTIELSSSFGGETMALKFAVLLAAVALVSGCAGGGPGTERVQKGMTAPAFALSDIVSGEEINGTKTIQSHHATVIVIWSMACPDCREALLDVQGVYEEYGPKSIAFLGVNFDMENIQGVKAFVKAEGIEFPTLWDKRRMVTREFKAMDYTFSVFVVDRMGAVVLAQYDHPPDLQRVLAKALDDVLD